MNYRFNLYLRWCTHWLGLQAFANHCSLSLLFLDHVVDILNHVPVFRDDDIDKAESKQNMVPHTLNQLPVAATLALECIFRWCIVKPVWILDEPFLVDAIVWNWMWSFAGLWLVRSVYPLVLFYKPKIRLYKEISGSIASRCLLYNCVHSSKSVDSCWWITLMFSSASSSCVGKVIVCCQ